MKFARNVRFMLKEGKVEEFKGLFDKEVLPVLRKQAGFSDELALVSGKMAIGISFWDDKASAEAYQKSAYPGILKSLQPCIEGTPQVETYEVASTTIRM